MSGKEPGTSGPEQTIWEPEQGASFREFRALLAAMACFRRPSTAADARHVAAGGSKGHCRYVA
jgi:hypothetical protein